MHITNRVLKYQQHASSYVTIEGKLDVAKLKVAALNAIHVMAWQATLATEDALEILRQHPEHEPTEDELADRTHPGFGWREVVRWAGYLTLKNKLEADLATEIQLIETSILLAVITGRKVVGLIPVTENPPSENDFTILVSREGFSEMVWLDLAYNFCPDDPDGLHHIGCGCDL